MLTLSIIKADTGGFVGHSAVHPDMIDLARWALDEVRTSELLLDGHVATCGDDLSLIMTPTYGADAQLIHEFAWDIFTAPPPWPRTSACTEPVRTCCRTRSWSGNLRGMGPGYAELDLEEQPSEVDLLPRRQDRTGRVEPGHV